MIASAAGATTRWPDRADKMVVHKHLTFQVKVALYLRVLRSTQITSIKSASFAIVSRMGCEIATDYKDHCVRGAKGHDKEASRSGNSERRNREVQSNDIDACRSDLSNHRRYCGRTCQCGLRHPPGMSVILIAGSGGGAARPQSAAPPP